MKAYSVFYSYQYTKHLGHYTVLQEYPIRLVGLKGFLQIIFE